MPVRKFRSVASMPSDGPLTPLDPEGLRIACELSELAYGLHRWTLPAGVRKFRSVAEAAERRDEWERAQVRGDSGPGR